MGIFCKFDKFDILHHMQLEVYGANDLNFVEFNITGDVEGSGIDTDAKIACLKPWRQVCARH